MNQLYWIVPSIIAILFGLLKLSRQAGRIEEGVKGLYTRVGRLEQQSDRRRTLR